MPVFVMQAHPAPEISVIIPSRDGVAGGNVPRLLAAVRRQQRAAEAEILLVVGERPNGHARNVGVAAARGRWLVFMDDDAGLVGETVLVSLLAPLEEATPREGRPIGMTGAATCLPAGAGPFQRRVAAALSRAVFPEVDRITETDMAHHLCCALPRHVYEEVGGESDTLETGTDVDLRHRLRRAGYRIVVVPHTVASHPQPDSLGALWRKNLWYGAGRVQLHRLHPPAGRHVIRGGRGAALAYAARALLTFPVRIVRLERAAPWRYNPLAAVADLAQKLGYARAYWRHLHGRGPTEAAGWLDSAGWERRLRRRQATSPPPPPQRVRRLLLVATAGLGDAITLLPLLAALRRAYPQARITAWTAREGARRVLASQAAADRIVLRSLAAPTRLGRIRRKLAAVAWLRRQRFDLAVVNFINSNAESALLLYLGGVPWRCGTVAGEGTPSLFNLPVPHAPPAAGRRAVDRHLDILPVLGARPTAGVPRWRLQPAAVAAAARLLTAAEAGGRGPLVGLHPGSGGEMAWKRWPAERFAALGDALAAEGCGIALFGGPEEAELVAAVRRQMTAPALDLTTTPDLDQTAALLARCALFVSNDSGLYNLALSLPVPVVALFGPSLPQISGPWDTGRPAAVLTTPVPCHPCLDPRRPPRELACPIERRCLTGVTLDDVLAACRQILAGPPPPRPPADKPLPLLSVTAMPVARRET